ncbi:hypothetical protein N7499_012370 [Penicillium canescens]|nr:hypothetical protein N7499_012370 [Penicillium canescens]KAJ6154813.1 hypothetical protein N7485_013182 [Penicillium canescens]
MSALYRWLGPLYDALFCPSLPFTLRWRLLAFQPIVLLTNTIQFLSTLVRDNATVIWIPLRTPGHSIRAIVYPPPEMPTLTVKRLHLNIHGGGFLGGLPEGNALFCRKVAAETGAVVISTSYRYAPRYTFPTAHEDVQDVADWMIQNAGSLWGADPRLLTVSGFSAGGNLALGVAQRLHGSEFSVKASVTFYTPVDLRLPPWEKPKPPGFPVKDPLRFLLPLMDAYAGPERQKNRENALLHPILANIESLPRKMLFVVPKVDILLHEQTLFVQRLEEEAAVINRRISQNAVDLTKRPLEGVVGDPQFDVADPYQVESMFFDGQIHGWLEVPSIFIDVKTRDRVFDDVVHFLNNVFDPHDRK